MDSATNVPGFTKIIKQGTLAKWERESVFPPLEKNQNNIE
jgi:hypothetical protein